MFFNAHDPKQEHGLGIVSKVSKAMPEDSEVQFDSLKLFIKYNKATLALRSISNLIKQSPTYCKAERALNMFNDYLL